MSDNALYAALDAEDAALADARRAHLLRRRVERRLRARLGVPGVVAALYRLVDAEEAADRRRREASAIVEAIDRLAAQSMPPLASIGRLVEVDDNGVRAALALGMIDLAEGAPT